MKKSVVRSFVLASAMLVLSNCKKYGQDYDTYFYTNVENSSGPMMLYVDGTARGNLPNLKSSCSVTNDSVIFNALHIVLKAGKYKIEAKDTQGNVKTSGTLKFHKHSLHGSCTMGGQATSSSANKVVTELIP